MSDTQRLGDGQLDPPDEPDCEHCEGSGEITTIDGAVLACPSCLDQELAAVEAGRHAMTMTAERLRSDLADTHARIAELEAMHNDDVLAAYSRTDGHREWVSVGSWLHPGDKIVVIYNPTTDRKGRG